MTVFRKNRRKFSVLIARGKNDKTHLVSLTISKSTVKEERKEMIDMTQVRSIRTMHKNGEGVSSISRALKVSEPTVRKYLRMDDFNPKLPVKTERPSKLDAFKETINRWLLEDKAVWHKQRHTAKRIYDRLVLEEGYDGSYPIVQRYVKEQKSKKTDKAYLDLVWEPATAQVDFGQADIVYHGDKMRIHYLVVSFPYSNVGLMQVFFGENAECVCEGLARIFAFIGGVPLRCVFDNATGVGKRVINVVKLTDLFARFEMHYGFESVFCNPNSGHEKGNVENMVGKLRRNMLVPVPVIADLDEYNERLLISCMEEADDVHYRKGENCIDLFGEDTTALRSLPEKEFSCVRYEQFKADKQGNICVGGRHRYSTDVALCGQKMIVGFGAFTVEIYDSKGNAISKHNRLYTDGPDESVDSSASLRLLVARPGGWPNSRIRLAMPCELREHIDSVDKDMVRSYLSSIANAAEGADYDTAIEAARMVVKNTGQLRKTDLTMYVTRLYLGGGPVYDIPVDLKEYDAVFS